MKSLNAINLEDYENAILRLATYKHLKSNQNSGLVFALVELLNNDRPKPDSSILNHNVPDNIEHENKQVRIYYRRIALRADIALNWYADLLANIAKFPRPLDQVNSAPFDGKPIDSISLKAFPSWPGLETPQISNPQGVQNGSYSFPFIGAGAKPCKISRAIGTPNNTLENISDSVEVLDWLQRRFNFSFSYYSEYLGGATLVASNLNVRSVGLRTLSSEEEGEKTAVQLLLRNSGQTKDLNLKIVEERNGVFSESKSIEFVKGEVAFYEVDKKISKVGYELVNRKEGLIEKMSPTPLLRNISSNLKFLKSERVKFSTHEGKGGAQTTKINEFYQSSPQKAFNSEIGKKSPSNSIEQRIAQAEQKRTFYLKTNSYEQIWLNNPEEAKDIIRKLIASASKRVFLVDPYIRATEIQQYLYFIKRSDVSIKVLTTTLGRKKIDNRTKIDKINFYTEFKKSTDFLLRRGVSDIQIKEAGANSFHDRFLQIDDSLWYSGNSFSNIGEKASLIVKLVDPALVLNHLLDLFSDANIIFGSDPK